MNECHREILQENLCYLQENVLLDEVQDYLFQDRILSSDDIERLSAEKTEKDRIRQLVVHMLPRAGQHAFASFVNALTNIGQSHASKHLLEEEKKKLKKGKHKVSTYTVSQKMSPFLQQQQEICLFQHSSAPVHHAHDFLAFLTRERPQFIHCS